MKLEHLLKGRFFYKVAVGKLVRTYGQIALLTKQESFLFIMPVINQTQLVDQTKIIKLTIPAYSLLFIKQNQFVEHQQVLAEVSTSLTEKIVV
jgi:hypothetical protein